MVDRAQEKSVSGAAAAGSPRVLLLRFHSLGDVVLTTGIIRALARGYANGPLTGRPAQVEVLTDARWRPILEGLPEAARIWTREEMERTPPSPAYDLVVDLQATPGARRLARRFGPVQSLRTRAAARRWVVLWGDRFPRPSIPTTVERYAEAAGLPAGDEGPDLRPEVRVLPADLDEARRLVPEAMNGEGGRAVALLTGASRRSKEYPPDRVRALAGRLRAEGLPVWWIAPSDPAPGRGRARGEEPAARARREAEGSWSREGAVWRLTLSALKAVLSRAAVVVANDSGPMHLAQALGVPVVALFGSSVRAFGFAPSGAGDVIVEARGLACRPCGVHGRNRCWLGHWRCLRELSMDEVLDQVRMRIRKDGR